MVHREINQFNGWRVSEAIRRCSDPDQLTRWFGDHGSWRASGARGRFLFRSELVEGADAVYHNQRERAAKALRDRSTHGYAGLKSSLKKALFAERLVAWGRYGSPLASQSSVPASAWNNLSIVDVRKSVAQESSITRNKIFDLRIYPIVHAPDALDRLIGRTFVEALHMSVIGDPQIFALRQRVINVGGLPIEFGYIWEPYRAVWPAKFGQGGMSEAAIGFLRKFDVPTQYNAERAAARVVGRRFAAMMSFLSAGHIVAEGTPRGGGPAVAVPRSLWQRSETYIDLENGDIIEMNRHADDHTTALSKPVFTGLIFQRPAAPNLPSMVQKQTLTPDTTASFDNKAAAIITKTTSRDACKLWLCRLMTESPLHRPKAKRAFWLEAQSKWPDTLAERAFNKAWDDAVESSGAVIWSAGGRPKKPSQSKPSHE